MNTDDRVVKVAGLRSAGEIRVGSNPTPCNPSQSVFVHFLKGKKVGPLPTPYSNSLALFEFFVGLFYLSSAKSAHLV